VEFAIVLLIGDHDEAREMYATALRRMVFGAGAAEWPGGVHVAVIVLSVVTALCKLRRHGAAHPNVAEQWKTNRRKPRGAPLTGD
jgi:hypothetical protein